MLAACRHGSKTAWPNIALRLVTSMRNRRAIILRSAASFRLSKSDKGPNEPLEPMKSFVGAECWHLWTVVLPRRSITGRLIWGRVWRRHDRGRWIYKRFVEFDHRQVEGQ